MKPQDVVVLLKMSISPESEKTSYKTLAAQLHISAAEVHAATRRASDAGLLSIFSPRGRAVCRTKFLDWLVYSVAINFPAHLGPVTFGTPTGLTAVNLPTIRTHADDLPFVWPGSVGTTRGLSIKPLYKSVPVSTMNDPVLHECLALVDLLRIGRVREKEAAASRLRHLLRSATLPVPPKSIIPALRINLCWQTEDFVQYERQEILPYPEQTNLLPFIAGKTVHRMVLELQAKIAEIKERVADENTGRR